MKYLLPYLSGGARQPARAERGLMLVLVTALLFNLTIGGFYVLEWTQSGIRSALAFTGRVQATYLAEAGTNAAMARLSEMQSVVSLALPYELFPVTALGEGSFAAQVLNNPSDSGGLLDSDGLLVLEVVAWSRNQKHRRTIRSYIAIPSGVSDLPGAVVVGAGASGSFTGDTTISGYDSSNPSITTAAVAFESPGQTFKTSGTFTVSGTPDYSWASEAFTGDTNFSAQARALINTLASSPSAVHLTGNLKDPLGTTESPQITVIDAGKKAIISQLNTGSGVLIIRGQLRSNGGIYFDGLVLIEGQDGYLISGGDLTVNGGLVISPPSPTPSNPQDAIKCTGLTNILYRESGVSIFSSGGGIGGGLVQRSSVFTN